jgi:hypothetical protein
MNNHLKLLVFFGMMAFSALLCGCGEQYKAYNEAKELMSRGTEVVSYPIKVSNTGFPIAYTCYEWAADRFDDLGDYKDSDKLARECRYLAAIYWYERYIKNDSHTLLTLSQAYHLFVKAGGYKDALDKAVECSAEMLKYGLNFNANPKHYSQSNINITKLFQSFDENSKKQNAILLYQLVAPSLAAPNWGILIPFRPRPGLEDVDRSLDEDKKRSSFLRDLRYLELIRQYYPVPDEIREKMYRAALSAAEHEHFWQGNKQLQTEIFKYLGDYNDSAEWYRRCNEFENIPYIRDNSYRWQTNRTGGAPQARTIAIVLSDDGKNSTFLNAEIVVFGRWLKNETNGNIYFTSDASEASAVIHFTVSYTFYRTFHYQRGSPVDYYNSKAMIEIRSADGVLLLSETWRNNVTEPMSQIGFGVTKSYESAIHHHPEILQTLENHFRAKEGG